MTIKEMKLVLANKLKDENTYFTVSDISIKKHGTKYKIVIKDYEHIPFTMSFEYDEYFEYHIIISDDYENIAFVECVKNYNDADIKLALIELGYYIGTRF